MQTVRRHLGILGLALCAGLLSACFDSTGASTIRAAAAGDAAPGGAVSRVKVTLSGTPAGQVTAGDVYFFQPQASVNDGALRFAITGNPSWLQIDTVSGALSGTPTESDLGSHSGITITATTASGEMQTAELGPFAITVNATPTSAATGATGTATLKWQAPSQNSDGSALTDIAGYRIVMGTDPNALGTAIDIKDAAATSYSVSNLGPGTWYFAIRVYNSAGFESALSNIGSKTIS